MNIQEALKKIVQEQHRIAVYDALLESLERFLPSDTGDPEEVLHVEEKCIDPEVGVDIIESVQDELEKLRSDAAKRSESLNKLEISVAKPKRSRAKPRSPKPKPKP